MSYWITSAGLIARWAVADICLLLIPCRPCSSSSCTAAWLFLTCKYLVRWFPLLRP